MKELQKDEVLAVRMLPVLKEEIKKICKSERKSMTTYLNGLVQADLRKRGVSLNIKIV